MTIFAELNQTIQSYLGIFISLPVAIVVVAFIAVRYFKTEIKNFLGRMNKAKVGSLELNAESQKEMTSNAPEDLPTKSVPEEVKKLQKKLDRVSRQANAKVKDKDEFIKFLVERIQQYDFKYLDIYLVPTTKTVLALVAKQGQAGQSWLKSEMKKANIDPGEIEAVINALLVNQLVEVNGELFQVTSKGKSFAEYAGIAKLVN